MTTKAGWTVTQASVWPASWRVDVSLTDCDFVIAATGTTVHIESHDYDMLVTMSGTMANVQPIYKEYGSTSGTWGKWIALGEGEPLWAIGDSVGSYSDTYILIDTEVGGTPYDFPVSGTFPNTAGTMHFIDYTFRVPYTGHYSIKLGDVVLGSPSYLGGHNVQLSWGVTTIVASSTWSRETSSAGSYLGPITINYGTLEQVDIPTKLIYAGEQITIRFEVSVDIIQLESPAPAGFYPLRLTFNGNIPPTDYCCLYIQGLGT